MPEMSNEDEGFVVRLRGLPWTVTCEDILKFFGKLPKLSSVFMQCYNFYFSTEDSNIVGGLLGVHLTHTKEGRLTGEGYLELSSEEDVQRALTKHKETLGPRYIEGTKIIVFQIIDFMLLIAPSAFSFPFQEDRNGMDGQAIWSLFYGNHVH